jgi:hypothetical protein
MTTESTKINQEGFLLFEQPLTKVFTESLYERLLSLTSFSRFLMSNSAKSFAPRNDTSNGNSMPFRAAFPISQNARLRKLMLLKRQNLLIP